MNVTQRYKSGSFVLSIFGTCHYKGNEESPQGVLVQKIVQRIVFVSYLEPVFQSCVEESMRVVCDSYNKIPKFLVPISDNE
jgi:hypothetical protein